MWRDCCNIHSCLGAAMTSHVIDICLSVCLSVCHTARNMLIHYCTDYSHPSVSVLRCLSADPTNCRLPVTLNCSALSTVLNLPATTVLCVWGLLLNAHTTVGLLLGYTVTPTSNRLFVLPRLMSLNRLSINQSITIYRCVQSTTATSQSCIAYIGLGLPCNRYFIVGDVKPWTSISTEYSYC